MGNISIYRSKIDAYCDRLIADVQSRVSSDAKPTRNPEILWPRGTKKRSTAGLLLDFADVVARHQRTALYLASREYGSKTDNRFLLSAKSADSARHYYRYLSILRFACKRKLRLITIRWKVPLLRKVVRIHFNPLFDAYRAQQLYRTFYLSARRELNWQILSAVIQRAWHLARLYMMCAGVVAFSRISPFRFDLLSTISSTVIGATGIVREDALQRLNGEERKQVVRLLSDRVSKLVSIAEERPSLMLAFPKFFKVYLGTLSNLKSSCDEQIGTQLRCAFAWGATYPLVDEIVDDNSIPLDQRVAILEFCRDRFRSSSIDCPPLQNLGSAYSDLLKLVVDDLAFFAKRHGASTYFDVMCDAHIQDIQATTTLDGRPAKERVAKLLRVAIDKAASVRLFNAVLCGQKVTEFDVDKFLHAAAVNQLGDDLVDLFDDRASQRATLFSVGSDGLDAAEILVFYEAAIDALIEHEGTGRFTKLKTALIEDCLVELCSSGLNPSQYAEVDAIFSSTQIGGRLLRDCRSTNFGSLIEGDSVIFELVRRAMQLTEVRFPRAG